MPRLPLSGLLFCALLLTTTLANAQQLVPNACPSEISSCGCVITHTGTYEVANDLSASQTNAPNCIEIAASRSILNLKGFAVTGDGTGIGILIRPGADHVVVQGGDEGTRPRRAPDDECMSDATQSTVTQWNTAIEDDGDNAVIELLSLGATDVQPMGNTTAGIVFSSVHGSLASDFIACSNGLAGVIVRNSNGSNLSNFSAVSNDQYGLWLDSANDSTVATAAAASNGRYGMWLKQSSRNVIVNCNGTTNNGDTGILIGCGNRQCMGNERSDENRITNSGGPGNVKAGIVIQLHSGNNIVSVTHNDGNPDGFDMVDDNNNCGTDIWYNNTGTTNQPCIH